MTYPAEHPEQSVLGSLLSNPNAFDNIGNIISATDFYRLDHRLIFGALMWMLEQGKSADIDATTIADRLSSLNQLDECGGISYLTQLQLANPSAARIRGYAEIVRKHSLERQLLNAAAMIDEVVGSEKTIDEKIADAQALFMAIADAKASALEPVDMRTALTEVVTEIQRRYVAGGNLAGLSCGFDDVDKIMGGLKAGNLIVVPGRPAMGKTTWATNIAVHVAHERPVLLVSLEMSRDELAMRMLAAIRKVTLDEMQVPRQLDYRPGEEGWEGLTASAAMLTDKKIFIDEYSNTVARVAANARRIKRTQGDLGLIVIDYLGLMDGTGENKVQEIASITKGLKRLSKEMGIPVIVLAQLNRQVENRPNKRPLMSDLRDSGAIEQDADVIVTPFRDHYYTGNPETEGMAEIIVMKNRMGMTGTALAVFDGRHGCFIPACESAAAKYHRAMSENNTPAPAPKKTANTGFHLPA